MINLFFIGNEFYIESGTMMSSIYEVRTYKRFDWGFVQVALRQGKTVNIRPANDEEMLWAFKKLKSWTKQQTEDAE